MNETQIRLIAKSMRTLADQLEFALGTPVVVQPSPAPQPTIPLGGAWDPLLTTRGVKYTPGTKYRLVKATYEDKGAAQGSHHSFLDIRGVNGERLVGERVRFYWPDSENYQYTEAKSGEPWSLAFPLFAAGNGYSFELSDGTKVQGMGLGSIEEPTLGIHVSYTFIFTAQPATSNPIEARG